MDDAVRVIGVGNPDRGDDGVGPAVAARVAEVMSAADVMVSVAEPTHLIEAWNGAGSVVMIDAVVDGSPPGTVRVFDASAGELPIDVGATSSHGMGVGAAVALGRVLGRLPERVMVVGVSVGRLDGSGLSDSVERAVPGATHAVLEVMARA